MIVKLILFAAIKDAVGSGRLEIELGAQANVADLKQALVKQYPDLQPLIESSAISLNHEYATDDEPITMDAEVGVIPPVSGG